MATAKDTAPPTWLDGLLEIKGGINSGIAPLLLPPGQLAFATNCTMRGNLIQPRPAYRRLALEFTSTDIQVGLENGLWQDACYYKPDSGDESLRAVVGGRLFQVTPSATSAVVTELTIPGDPNPATNPQAWIWQTEKWTIWNDGSSIPIFTDETTSRRSLVNTVVSYSSTTAADFVVPPADGTSTVAVTLATALIGATDGATVINAGPGGTFLLTAGAGTTAITVRNLTAQAGVTLKAPYPITFTAAAAELPPGRMGTYGMGRNWISLVDGKQFMAGDIVGGPSGTIAENFRDSVLKSTENSYLAGGGYFAVPGSVGDIKAMAFSAILDTSLGQGALQVFTPNVVFSCNAPVDRSTWQNLTNPILTESLKGGGGLGQNSTLVVNSDFIMRSVDGIRSLNLARVYFQNRWSNVPISQEIDRILQNDDPALLAYGSAVNFNNRMLMTANPVAGTQGVYHPGLISLDFDPNSNLGKVDDPIYDGFWEGISILKILTGQFSDVSRCFAFCYNATLQKIELYELLMDGDAYADNVTNPITWSFETAPFFRSVKGKGIFDLAQLLDGELYVDDVRGLVNFQVYYKPDQYPCWTLWHEWSVCTDENNPLAITPADSELQPGYKPRMGLGEPDSRDCQQDSDFPMRIGRTFQVKVVVQGHCRITGLLVKAVHYPETKFSVPICEPICTTPIPVTTIYYNTEQCYTASCGEGFEAVYPATFCVEAGQVTSTVSQADADAKALAIAQYRAGLELVCEPVWWNTLQTYTATCPPGTSGDTQFAAVPPHTYSSTVSQADADAKALAAAKSAAEAKLVCTKMYGNTQQGYTAFCPGAQCGYPVTVVVPANTFYSTVSQADADAQALAYATSTAESELSCHDPYYNTEQTYTATCPAGYTGYPVTVTVPAGSFDSCISQADANALALEYATTTAEGELVCTPLSDWAARVVANGGATPSSNTQTCMSALYEGLINNGLLSKIHTMCIFVEDSLTAALTPLVNTLGNGLWTNHNFVSGDLTIDGLKGDGATKYLDTGLTAALGQGVDSGTYARGMSFVVTAGNQNADEVEGGVCNDGSGSDLNSYFFAASGFSVYDLQFTAYESTGALFVSGTPLQRCGYFSGNYDGTTAAVYQATPQDDHAAMGTKAVAAHTSNAGNLYVFRRNNTTGGTAAYSSKRLAMMSYHTNLTAAESETFWSLIHTCLQCLGNSAGDRATDWSYRVQQNGGAAPASSTVTALRTFCQTLHDDGINTSMIAVNVFAPDNLTAALTPLYNRVSNQPWTNHNFVAGDLSSAGLAGDASTKYYDFGIITTVCPSPFGSTSAGISMIAATTSASGHGFVCGAGGSATNSQFFLGISAAAVGTFDCWKNINPGQDLVSAALPASPFSGFISGSRTASNAIALYAANSTHSFALVTSGSTGQSGSPFATYPMFGAAYNGVGTPLAYVAGVCSFIAVHSGLNSTNTQALYSAAYTLRTSLGGGAP